jgi:hypothetical protein
MKTCTTCQYFARGERLIGEVCLRTRETRLVTSPVDGVTREEVSYTSCNVERMGRGLSALLLRMVSGGSAVGPTAGSGRHVAGRAVSRARDRLASPAGPMHSAHRSAEGVRSMRMHRDVLRIGPKAVPARRQSALALRVRLRSVGQQRTPAAHRPYERTRGRLGSSSAFANATWSARLSSITS